MIAISLSYYLLTVRLVLAIPKVTLIILEGYNNPSDLKND